MQKKLKIAHAALLILACVSYSCNDSEEEISIAQPSSKVTNGYEAVDMGLSVMWASVNVGANDPWDYGDYFAWGEILPKETYNWTTYAWCDGSETSIKKYYHELSEAIQTDTLDISDDAAHMNMGGAWRMPTKHEWEELVANCTWTWYEANNRKYNGVAGYEVAAQNGNSIFLPAAGSRNDDAYQRVGNNCDYWSSTLRIRDECVYAYDVNGGESGVETDNSIGIRYNGQSIRGVLDSHMEIYWK